MHFHAIFCPKGRSDHEKTVDLSDPGSRAAGFLRPFPGGGTGRGADGPPGIHFPGRHQVRIQRRRDVQGPGGHGLCRRAGRILEEGHLQLRREEQDAASARTVLHLLCAGQYGRQHPPHRPQRKAPPGAIRLPDSGQDRRAVAPGNSHGGGGIGRYPGPGRRTPCEHRAAAPAGEGSGED